MFTESFIVIDCFDLVSLYNRFLEPHLGFLTFSYDKERLIMDSVLNHLVRQTEMTVFDVGFEQHVPTDKLLYFYAVFDRQVQAILSNIDSLIKGQLIADYEQMGRYTILIKRLEYLADEYPI